MENDFISADDLVRHSQIVDWHEAVAIVDGLCELDRQGTLPPLGLDQVLVLSTGDLSVLAATTAADAPGPQLGYFLSAMLEGTQPPAELRLFASQAASGSSDATVDDFSGRLAYFTRPDRSAILRSLYERAAPAVAAAKARGEAGRPQPQQQAHAKASAKPERKQRQRAGQGALVFGVSMALVAVVVFVIWRSGLANQGASQAADVLVHADTSLGTAAARTLQAGDRLLQRVGLGSATPAPSPGPAPPEKPAPRPRVNRKPAAAPKDAVVADAIPSASGEPAAERAPADIELPNESAAGASAEPVPAPDENRLYTADDTDVSPPVLAWPQLPLPSDQAAMAEALAVGSIVDLVINERGIVDSVKIVTPLVQYRQRMLLSALKAWRYQPAIKDGRAVRFVQRVTLPL